MRNHDIIGKQYVDGQYLILYKTEYGKNKCINKERRNTPLRIDYYLIFTSVSVFKNNSKTRSFFIMKTNYLQFNSIDLFD